MTTRHSESSFVRAPLQQARGIELHVATAPGPELEHYASELGVQPHVVAMSRRVAPLEDVQASVAVARLVRRIRPDIVHAHTPKGGMVGMLGATLARGPARFYHMRGLPLLTARGPQKLALKASERLSCMLAERVFAVSPSLREAAVRAGVCHPSKIRVLGGGSSNGIDAANRYNPDNLPAGSRSTVRASLGIPADARVAGFVGRLALDKGIRELATAWQAIITEVPDAHMLVIGPLDERDSVPADAFAGTTNVHLLGHREDLPRLYDAMDVFLLPSYREGFPNVALEAASMRLPVVTTDAVGCRDAVLEGVTGSIVPVGDASALAAATVHYLQRDQDARTAGVRGRERALRDYRGEVIWQALHDEYNAAVQQRR